MTDLSSRVMSAFLSGLVRRRHERTLIMQLAVKVDQDGQVDEDKFASAVHYTITVETRNRMLTPSERAALAQAVQDALTHLHVKVYFIMGRAPEMVKVMGDRTSSTTGVTRMHPKTEASHDQDDPCL